MRDFRSIMEVKRYSKNTVEAYLSTVKLAEGYFKKELGRVSEAELHRFFYFMVNGKNASISYQKQMVGALKL